MRIGTNHGSLSDRILNRYGDTPDGMVESALEFVRICEELDYRELVISMKASNPVVALQAYRLLATRMDAHGMDYPFHLGVTEAGDGEDGRIKSAMGIGALLAEGIGDTVRVSLTEDPVAEIPVALALVAPYQTPPRSPAPATPTLAPFVLHGPFERRRSESVRCGPRSIGGDSPVLVEVPLESPLTDAAGIRRELDAEAGVRVPAETRAELVSVQVAGASEIGDLERLAASMELVAPQVALSARIDAYAWLRRDPASLDRLFRAVHRIHVRLEAPRSGAVDLPDLLQRSARTRAALLVEAAGDPEDAVALAVEAARLAAALPGARLLVAIDPAVAPSPLQSGRRLAVSLRDAGCVHPIVLVDRPARRGLDPVLGSATALGGLLCEGIGDAVHVEAFGGAARRLAFGILQGARVRMTRTEFISCPSCGRTLFDLEATTARIKARTAHLKGLKIAVMGCIVNGPGEMADADFGYVGWGDDKIALFVGKEMVEKDIPTSDADDRLVDLIRRHGRWVEPPVLAQEGD
jgi:(E)-4-hydroxy-3-methylbut-2-enyl-diphosphate synthase